MGLLRTRRYHALLLVATEPPVGRRVLVNGLEARIEAAGSSFPLTSQRYAPGVTHPPSPFVLESFTTEPWPSWRLRGPEGVLIDHQLLVPKGRPLVALSWARREGAPARLVVRPFLSGRDHHALHHENPAFRFAAAEAPGRVGWRPYDGVAGVQALSNGRYSHQPFWYRGFLYEEERARGLDHVEDLGSPGEITFDLGQEAVLVLAADGALAADGRDAAALLRSLREQEAPRRRALGSGLLRAADAYIVGRGQGQTVLAGYPWFTDWGRDTFIALRGLCLAGGRLDDARSVLRQWSGLVSRGMLPNRFPDGGQPAEFNSVDAALWFVVAAFEYLHAAREAAAVPPADERALREACLAIVAGYARGTRHGIGAAPDGLLACGEPGWQLTWMDARVEGREVTPRIGKPVEVQALWLNALRIASTFDPVWNEAFARGAAAFAERFWNEQAGGLYDVVDADHVPGRVDASFRPNQVLAVGGLPLPLLSGRRARRLVDEVERRLWTPMGLRTLDPADPAYRGHCQGGPSERDGAYHQGTVWPWLAGPFVEAWVRVRGGGPEVRAEARRRFLAPLLAHASAAGLDHVSEIADGDAPHAPRGCPFQAWSVGEALRLSRLLEGGGPDEAR